MIIILNKNVIYSAISCLSVADVDMVDTDVNKGLEESVALAKHLQEEDDRMQAEID